VYPNPPRWTLTLYGYLPRALFYALVRALPRLRAGELLDRARAVETGYLSARTDKTKRFKLDARLQRLQELANPTIGDDAPPNEPEA
jgi:hypothetical protein